MPNNSLLCKIQNELQDIQNQLDSHDHEKSCEFLDTCYYKLITHTLPAGLVAGQGNLLYESYGGSDPSTNTFDPVHQEGIYLEPHTLDNNVSVCVISQDGQKIAGSTEPTNYFHSSYSLNNRYDDVASRTWSFEFKSHKCAVVSKVYIHGTDVDGGGEQYDTSAFTGTNWVPASTSTVPGSVPGVFAATANNQRFVLEWDVIANGLPPVETISSSTSNLGSSVFVYMVDYYTPIKSELDCDGNLVHYDENGLFEGEVFEASEIGGQCCACPPDPIFFKAPPQCSLDITQGFNEKLWFGENALTHDNVSNIFNGFPSSDSGLPSHPNTPNINQVIPDAIDNSAEGGNAGTTQVEYWGWIYIPQDGVTLQDVNGNTGERIKYWISPICTPPVLVGEVTTNTAGGSTDFGTIATLDEGWYYIGKQMSDLSAFAGIQLQWDVDGAFVNVPAGFVSATQPAEKSSCLTKGVPFASIAGSSSDSGTPRVIYSEEYFARSANGTTQSSARNMTVTQNANNTWTATLTPPHPDGVNYHPSITPEEQFANRDGVIAQVVQGTLTASGFDFMLITGDNGGSQDLVVTNTPYTVSIDAPVTVIESIN